MTNIPKVTGDPMARILSILCDKVYEGSVPEEITELLQELDKKGKFKKPTPEEVISYMREKKVSDPVFHGNKFWNFYETKGWMVGKNKMKNWKSCIATWDLPKTTI